MNKNVKNLKLEKLKMWKQREAEIQKKLVDVMQKKGAAAQEGDLSENAAYLFALEEAEMLHVQLINIQQMIRELERS